MAGQGAAAVSDPARRGIRFAQLGILTNVGLAITKLVAGLVGNAYVLVADAIESTVDIFSSLIVWGGLRFADRDPDESYPFGYGKAEAIAAAVVALLVCGAALGIAIEAVEQIRTPHRGPAAWTLVVLVGVVLIKWALSRRVHALGSTIGSTAVKADAFHHLSDALTSAAAFIGIGLAVLGGPGWEKADDWAAIAASGVIGLNGVLMLRASLGELMDRTAGADVLGAVRRAAESVAGVMRTEKMTVRKAGMVYRVTIHVQADPAMSLDAAHRLGGAVKGAIRAALPQVQSVLVHMEPYHPDEARFAED